MNTPYRTRLEMGRRVYDFGRAHPTADGLHDELVRRLGARIDRAQALSEQHRAGVVAARNATRRRNLARAALHAPLLRTLSAIAAAAAQDDATLAGKFALPASNASNDDYMTGARVILAETKARQQQLLRYGLTVQLLQDVEATLRAFAEASTAGRDARRMHVAAHAELGVVIGEAMRLVNLLNGLNRYRFRESPEVLAAWESARHLPPRRAAGEAGEAGEGGGAKRGGQVAA
jgi:hypothetical protein